MNILESVRTSFSDSYQEARTKFLDAAGSSGLNLASYENPNPGPRGELLACDTAWAGPRDAKRVLVIVSATHGVEGFCGSGCQIDWLGAGLTGSLPADTAALIVHAINPHGFAWHRRVTEEGCDLNRNFLDFTKPLPENMGHDELVDSFVPAHLDDETLEIAEAKIHDYRATHGERAFQSARKAGQYRHEHSMFFGGFAPSWARRTLETIISDFDLAKRDLVAVIDFHTGLGPFGYGEPISGHLPGTPGFEWITRVYGESVGVPELGTSASIPLHGTARDLWDRFLDTRYAYVALEYGTYSQERSRMALRADHWLHNQGPFDWESPEARRIKDELKWHYYPASDDWKEMVLWRSRQLIRQATEALSSS
ncbi:MAG: M14 family metallopeptidase [Alphaproteobacteria bacterium]|nr:M14 family metallopeptidase [Alphaproteobacteria bacterium]